MITKEQRGLFARKLAIPDEAEDKDLPPLDAAFEERLIAQTQAQLADNGDQSEVKTPARLLAPKDALAPVIDLNERREARGGKRQLRAAAGGAPARSWRWLGRTASVWLTCAAASLCFWLWGPAGAPLSSYEVAVHREAQHLGTPGGSPTNERIRLSLDSRLQIDLRPREKVNGPLEVAAYRRIPGTELTRWSQGEAPESRRIDSNGIIRIDTTVQDSKLTPGLWQLIFVIGRQHHLPSDEEVRSALRSGQLAATSSKWQIRSVYVDIATQQ